MIHAPCRAPLALPDVTPLSSDEDSLAECVSEAVEMIGSSSHPLILAGVELHRFGLGDEALRLVETAEIPFSHDAQQQVGIAGDSSPVCGYLSRELEPGNCATAGGGLRLSPVSGISDHGSGHGLI